MPGGVGGVFSGSALLGGRGSKGLAKMIYHEETSQKKETPRGVSAARFSSKMQHEAGIIIGEF